MAIQQRSQVKGFGQSTNEKYIVEDIHDIVTELNSGGGLKGSNYVYVAAAGTDIQNAAELLDAYTTAQGMSPSATNRITVIASPGYYNLGVSTFTMNTEYIDLVSLDGNCSVIFNAPLTANYPYVEGSINVTANDVFVKGVNVLTKEFGIGYNKNLNVIENCKGGDYSFGANSLVSGTFINCIGGERSFGGNLGGASGKFIDCVSTGPYSFGGEIGASGIFINCSSPSGSSFSFYGPASGTFTNCVSGFSSFGGGQYGAPSASGVFTNCVSGSESFGFHGTCTGKLYYCRLTSGTFKIVSGSGQTRYCLDGTNTANNQG